MIADTLKNFIRKVTPKFILNFLIKRRNKKFREFADFILASAVEFSKSVKGDPDSFDRRLTKLLKTGEGMCNEIIQDILSAFMPDFEHNLYDFYKNQQYLIFYRFLQYPFINNMSNYTVPYENALIKCGKADILDYGSGIPFGLIYSLLNRKETVRSVTLIDLDLIHVDFVQFLVKKIAPEVNLKIHRLTDADTFPKLEGKYNFFFGKDIFEHLSDPLKNLKELMKYSQPEAICYFDFRDHGVKLYQHITPDIEFLKDEMVKMGFTHGGRVQNLSEFTRNL